ncbi:3-dehydroquinate synthase [Deinococcus irradiatisoli]|uniref:3-dehydroquinate synthase n=1 Tax=Deinococcus irradiatisoli TaxID=2202254 RepID=A0A2Z3JGE7_9DEIO|nr:3-dehydroquinate synthase [Deinococcus irradiatisoli]AWN24065.1 3-dehydroquinate synthase [Deinococcus irradiatisoli]
MPATEARRIEVGGASPYTVEVGRGLLSTLSVPHKQVALLHPDDLPPSLVAQVQAALSPTLTLSLPPRDDCKTLEVFSAVLSRVAGANLTRDSAVVGLGGGALTDLAGFVAASYLRGVAYYAVPTTLLGMVDAAVGGKTGVNLPEGKNLAGAFWPPKQVWADVDTLASLPDATFREGAAEIFKHGLIADPSLLPRVLAPDFGPRSPELPLVIADAVAVKAGVVTRDLTEQGERAYLNFGHTLAHAIEAVTNHAVSHGDAVGYGMHYAALLSREMGGADLTAHTRAFLAYQRPSTLPFLTFEQLWPYMARDKKADAEGVRFVLLQGLAQPHLTRVPEEVLRRAFAEWQRQLTPAAHH